MYDVSGLHTLSNAKMAVDLLPRPSLLLCRARTGTLSFSSSIDSCLNSGNGSCSAEDLLVLRLNIRFIFFHH